MRNPRNRNGTSQAQKDNVWTVTILTTVFAAPCCESTPGQVNATFFSLTAAISPYLFNNLPP